MPDARSTVIHLVRHGDVRNPQDIIYGRLPRFRLSAYGQEQAARTAAFLSGERLAAIYTSPQLRARQTAAAIAAHHPQVPLRRSALLAEIKTSWQGAPNSALDKYFNFFEPLKDPADETIADIHQRMHRLIQQLLRRHPGQRIVCVSHGDPIVIARTSYAGLPLDFANLRTPDYPERGSVTSLVFNGRGEMPYVSYFDPNHHSQ